MIIRLDASASNTIEFRDALYIYCPEMLLWILSDAAYRDDSGFYLVVYA